MEIKLMTRNESSEPWQTVTSAKYDSASLNSMASAMEEIAKAKDKWQASGVFPATAAWRIEFPDARRGA